MLILTFSVNINVSQKYLWKTIITNVFNIRNYVYLSVIYPLNVSFSAVFRLFLATLITGIHIQPIIYAGAFLTMYTVYSLDRYMDVRDNIPTDIASKSLSLYITLLLVMSALLLYSNNMIDAALVPLVAGAFYSIDLSKFPLGFNLKKGLGGKNLVVALTWGLFIGLIIDTYIDALIPIMLVVFYFFSKSFINTVIYDFRDIEEDREAGIKTLPVELPETKLRNSLHLYNLVAHAIIFLTMFGNYLRLSYIFIASSLAISTTYIYLYADSSCSGNDTYYRDLIVDGEFYFITASCLVSSYFF